MECIILAPGARCRALQWRLEDLGADWRCTPALQAETALHLLHERKPELAVLGACEEAAVMMAALTEQPLLSPPYVLGDGFPAADGELPEIAELPELMRGWKQKGRLPALCGLRLEEAKVLARGVLHALGVSPRLRAWHFLPDMVALTVVHPPLLTDLQHGLYPLAGACCGMTAAAVERSLRLCVESTWSHGELTALERFFGSSVDPDKGKPTNREFLCRMQERVTLGALRLGR